jgi:hypothetical protein
VKPIDFEKLSILANDPKDFAMACSKRISEQYNESGHKMSAISVDDTTYIHSAIQTMHHSFFCTQCPLQAEIETWNNGKTFLLVDGDTEQCISGKVTESERKRIL